MKNQFMVLLVSRGLSSIFQALSLVLLVRWVGAETFGLIAVITGIAAVVYTLSDWGAASHLPRSKARGDLPAVVTGLRLSVLGNSVAGTVFTVVILYLSFVRDWNLWLCVIPLALGAEQYIEAALTLSVADRSKRVVLISIALRRISSLGVFVGAHWLGMEALGAYSLGLAASTVLGLVHVAIDVRRRTSGVSAGRLRISLLKSLLPYVVANLSSSSRNLDTSIVAAVTSAHGAGLYSAAFRLTKPLNQVGGAASAVLLPHAARSSVANVQLAAKRLSLVSVLALVPAAVLGCFSESIVVTLFGVEFVSSAPAFAWALMSIAPVCLAPPLGSLLQGVGHERFVAWNGVIFGVVTLVAVWVGAVIFGVSGAAGGLTIAYCLKSAFLAARIGALKNDVRQPEGIGLSA